jgi:hypothetical protein
LVELLPGLGEFQQSSQTLLVGEKFQLRLNKKICLFFYKDFFNSFNIKKKYIKK